MGMRTIFQVLTLEGWVDLTYNYSDANDPTIAVIFFVGIVSLGAFFAMNLVLGAVMESFYDQQQESKEERERLEEEQAAAEKAEKAEEQDAAHATERATRGADNVKIQENYVER